MAKRLPKPATEDQIKAVKKSSEDKDTPKKGWYDENGKYHDNWMDPMNPSLWSEQA